MLREVLEVITTIEIFHADHMIPTITYVLKDDSMQLIKYNPTHSQSKKNKNNMQTNYVCTTKIQITLLATIQKSKCNTKLGPQVCQHPSF
jgi:hypothetical protein